MKRILALILMTALLISLLPAQAFAAKQMNDGVPVWTEETVRQYVMDYAEGKSMARLYEYYDLQIRRYMPNETFESLLVDWYWMTGEFLGLGTYRSFAEPERQLKTHVIHLCMEKQDLDLYFTHKDKDNDWEIMALEFVPAEEQDVISSNDDMLVGGEEDLTAGYSEQIVTVGQEPYLLEGILTLPDIASAQTPVPACVLVHDDGPYDRDLTLGKTTMFKDLADLLGRMDVATIRYDKRTYAYPDVGIETVMDEVVNDALSAVEILKNTAGVDSSRIVVLGLGFGGQLVARIAGESENSVAGLILVGASKDSLLQTTYEKNKASVAALPKKEAEDIKSAVRNITSLKEEKVRSLTLFGKNGYYYWDLIRNDFVKQIKNLRLPVLFMQGRNDPYVDEYENGVKELNQHVGTYKPLYTYLSIRGLNHILMDDRTTNEQGEAEYQIETKLDRYAGMKIGEWIWNLNTESK